MKILKTLSIIVPAFNESEGLKLFYKELTQELKKHNLSNYEILFINDGSNDNTEDIIKNLQEIDENISFLNLSRNHGKEIALAAGFDFANSDFDAFVIMDADLQHPPKLISDFILKFEEGYDDVYAVRKNRDDESFLKKKFTNIYYNILQKSSSIKVYKDVGDYRLLSKNAFNYLKKIKEKERYTKGFYSLIGFKKFPIEFEVPERAFGQTKWNYLKLTQLAINGITSFSIAPLRISTILGLTISFFSFLYLIFVISKTIILGEEVSGFPTLISTILLLGGIQLLALGVIGEYIGKIFNEVKNRPLYFVSEFIKKNEKK